MNTRVHIFTLLIATLIFQGYAFAAGEEPNVTEDLIQHIDENKWGEPNNGLITQLISQSEEYVVGKPMKFGLVMKNVSDSVKEYDRQVFIACCGSLMVKSADNNELYDKRGPYQTQGAPHPIEAGEIVILFESRDITDEYVIIEPGKYIIQFRGIPSSNVIEFEVKPGTPDERDLLVSMLVNILPDSSWRVTAPKKRNTSTDSNKEALPVILARGGYLDGIGVMLWQIKTQEAIYDRRRFPPLIKYLGKNDSGYFYLEIPPEALDYWPTIKEDIIKSLELDSSGNDGP